MHTTFSFCPSFSWIIDRKCCILSGPPCIIMECTVQLGMSEDQYCLLFSSCHDFDQSLHKAMQDLISNFHSKSNQLNLMRKHRLSTDTKYVDENNDKRYNQLYLSF